ncbi:hypothetical protein [Streptomyces dysideae]|uniref:Uncharacterized protein n=1 Tax=Streptomyces dysideae TaxID=909626 RepID=A0A101V2S9_9ACTN|nr:hypothetical protein [Streptomyces dysideae]KUO21475.1 hypothetical protein AQJ91_09070 [Streptomyces dysideae]
MTALLYVLLLLVVALAVTLAGMWLRVCRLALQMDALRAGLDGVRIELRTHSETDHSSRLLVIADRPDDESAELMKAQATAWGWEV